jgi:hypothetical protein
VLEGAGERNQPLPTTEGIVPTQTNDRTLSAQSSVELAAQMHDLSVHLWNALSREAGAEPPSCFPERATVETLQDTLEQLAYGESIRAAAELVPGETFTHTGVLIVRIRATTGNDARGALASAAHAALESSLGIVRVEGTDVTRNPAPRRGGAR